jgi:SH3-like domain-containing protein
MSLTNCTGRASHTDDPKAWMTRAAISPPYVVTCEQARSPTQYCQLGISLASGWLEAERAWLPYRDEG